MKRHRTVRKRKPAGKARAAEILPNKDVLLFYPAKAP
jgi:hypothetical protein